MPENLEEHVLVLAPTGRDAKLVASNLRAAGLSAHICEDVSDLCDGIEKLAASAVLAEEALTFSGLRDLSDTLGRQPPWSDFPLVVLSEYGQERAEAGWQTIGVVESIGNVTLLERPIHEITLLSAVSVALRARRKQYQMKRYLEDRLAVEEALRESENKLRAQAEGLELRVRQRTAELLCANKELEGFAYSIAHDMRGPLRRLMFISALIQQDYEGKLDPDGRSTLKELASEAKKMSVLVEDLLQYARLGKQTVRTIAIDFSALANRIADEVMGEQRTQFSIEPGIQIQGDASLLELVLRNLVDNACKYSNKDTPVISIGYDPNSRALYVRDNGIGFEMEFAAKIFQPFERLHRDCDYAGTGIGLANVKRIIERHGGNVWAVSKPGMGATFYFTLGPGGILREVPLRRDKAVTMELF